ncbi:MAG: HhoA/HhoB/HtrA family serine endopeptidase [Cyanobacteriota bacterium]|nr:HhoA/HhoB/HtrA family serine endopeptidase [Cyanobacteriota bacterium]
MTTSDEKNKTGGKFSASQAAIGFLLLLVGAGSAIVGQRVLLSRTADPIPEPESTPAPAQVLPLPVEVAEPDILISDPEETNFIVAAVNRVEPAVVRIDAARPVTDFGSFPPRLFVPPGFGGSPQERVERGTGSGFLIDPNGQILTNAHVVDGTDTVEVTLKDGRRFEGQVLGTDPLTDVAVVKIEATSLPTVSIGNSDLLQPGEWAIAIGNPLGLDSTVTVGIISATGRSSTDVGVPDKRVGFIQTDAAINPGNSGGPLLNASGEVIGMNTAIISGAQGLGFSIPIETAKRIAQQLITSGKVEHPYLGIQMVDLTPENQEQINTNSDLPFKIEVDRGVVVLRVIPDSPAEVAGFQAGDVIQKMENQPISRSEAVQQIVQASSIGTPLEVEVNRNQQTLTLTVTPGELPVQ